MAVKEPKNQRAALYVRVSTTMQIDRDSLPYQRQELSNYSKYVLGIDDFEIFEDAGYSAKNTDRPRFQEMMRRCRSGEFTHLLVWKIDRISRNLRDFAEMYDELKECGVVFISKNEQFDTGNAMGEAMLKIILVFAELERKLTAERVSAIMFSRAEKGLWNGAPVPFGYKWDEEKEYPVVDEDEAETVTYIYDKYQELRSALKVMHLLDAEGRRTKRGGKWTSKTIVDIIRSPMYKGDYRYNYRNSARGKLKDESEWIIVEDNHEAIVSKEQWEVCNEIMNENGKRNTAAYRRNSRTHVFSGLVRCVRCGTNFIAHLDTARKDGYRPSMYRCRSVANSTGCDAKMIGEVTLGPFMINYIANLLKAQASLSKVLPLKQFEKALLRGKVFADIAGIEQEGLELTYNTILYGGQEREFYEQTAATSEDDSGAASELASLAKEKKRYERALDRLQNLYLFSEESMPEKDYLLKKKELSDSIDMVNKKMAAVHEREASQESLGDISFLQKASLFYVRNELMSKKMIDYRKMVKVIDRQLLKDFMNTVVARIDVDDGKVQGVTFKNGLTHRFVYRNKK